MSYEANQNHMCTNIPGDAEPLCSKHRNEGEGVGGEGTHTLMASSTELENPSPMIVIPQQWSEAAESIAYDSVTSPPPIAFVCGAKNCGKTTFSRHLLNILLQRSMLSCLTFFFFFLLFFCI